MSFHFERGVRRETALRQPDATMTSRAAGGAMSLSDWKSQLSDVVSTHPECVNPDSVS